MPDDRLLKAAKALIAAEDIPAPTVRMGSSDWLRREADKMEAKEKALAELKAAVECIPVPGDDAA